ncbi:MAG: class II aldolase/adducin family protein [Candidatus Omnitrophica bacterium]|nr:class II aldolase/adducin family protein [Candidatus Omnitrophota bacterium]
MKPEGVIRFRCEWDRDVSIADRVPADLLRWRDELLEMGLVGVDAGGIGFGNLSIRLPEGGFVITGSQTGHVRVLKPENCSKGTRWDYKGNRLWCEGPAVASSESLTHAAVYDACERIHAVVHVHHPGLWAKHKDTALTTSMKSGFGTAELAGEVRGLLSTGVGTDEGFLVMGGHKDGLVFFGKSLEIAGKLLIKNVNRLTIP